MLTTLRSGLTCAALAVLIAATVADAAAPAPKATLATFAGTWGGHTRSLTISRKGVAKESVGSGCCDPIIDLKLRLSHPRGTKGNASIKAKVTWVRVRDKSAYTKKHPAPHVGQTARLRLKHGVITEPLTETNYCDEAAGKRGTCGA
jgi:hypothetical protein